ncbi:MAG: N-acetylneuraminate synthase family protein [Kiritimatiellia bacterium]|jgi:N-acetylneuraminate synthase|nr:N-acetylneuraminate synthase family protein [Kiritimatiellia bacterium]MDP6781629.1 N-acetylneuraminate synthase family protein [Alphaproteobacteria bacterium]|tara:strand:- start:612 stop:1643 length:1032 start_codon:yes stop_codon:yes gene_type:complete
MSPVTLFPGIEGCAVIAEVAQSHDGHLDTAHGYIDAIAAAGAHGVKFQTHMAAAESTPHEPWRVKFSAQDESRFDYWKRMEFSEEEWAELRAHAAEKNLLFLSSPFSDEAVDLLERVGVEGWKIASGEAGTLPMLEKIAATGKPVLLSTGMSPWAEIDTAVDILRTGKAPLAVMQCTSIYPTPPEKTGLNVISELRRRYDCAVGLSDHSGTIYPALAAVAEGIEVLEVHVTFDREDSGPDVPASVTFEELRQVMEGIRFVETARRHPLDKDAQARELEDLRAIFTKSIVAVADLAAGTVLEPGHLCLKKPGSGLPAARLEEIVGRTLKRDVAGDELLSEDDLS